MSTNKDAMMPPFSATQAVKDALSLALRRFPLLLLVSLVGTLLAVAILAMGLAPLAAWGNGLATPGGWTTPPASLYPTLLLALLGFAYAASAQIAVLGLDVRGRGNGVVDALWVGLKGLPALLFGYLALSALYICALVLGGIAVAAFDMMGLIVMGALFLGALFVQIVLLPWPFLAVVEGRSLSAFATARAITRGRRGAIFGGLLLLLLALFGIAVAGGLLAMMLGAVVGIFSYEGTLVAGIVAGLVQMLFHGYSGAATLAYIAVVYEQRVFLDDGHDA